MKTVWIYVDTNHEVGDRDHLKVFADSDAADGWLEKHDPEGVAFRYEVEGLPAVARDQERIARALHEARGIIGEYLEPGIKNPTATLNRLIEVLDTQELAAALGRLVRGPGLRLVK